MVSLLIRKITLVSIILILLFSSSCSTPFLNAGGVYVSQNATTYVDTLTLWVDGANNSSSESKASVKFKQNIYDKQSGVLVQTNQGLWRITGSKISFKDIYLIQSAPEAPDKLHTTTGLSFAKDYAATLQNDEIVFSSTLYYQKVK